MGHLPNLILTSASISAVLPAFNEAAVIDVMIRHVAEALSRHTADLEIVVVNDGSRDDTGAVLARLQRTEPVLNLRVVTHSENRGYGAALASGFAAATKSLIFMTDGDEQFDVAEISLLLDQLDDGTDMVIGWRQKRADPLLRRMNAWGWNSLVRLLFGYTARDVDCAFKLIRRDVWERLAVRSRGATFSAELLIKARRLGFGIREVPVSHFARTAGSPTGARLHVITRAFAELVCLRWNLDQDLGPEQHASSGSLRPTTNHSSSAA